jgi:hypothetical protein
VTIAVQLLAILGDNAADALEDIIALPSCANRSELGLRLTNAIFKIARGIVVSLVFERIK